MRGRALACVLFATAASANEAFLKAEAVDAAAVGKLPAAPSDPAWGAVTGRAFRITPQRTLRLNDRKSNDVLAAGPGVGELRVKAAVAGQQLALLLEWDDAAKEVVREDEVNVFADSIAVEVPETPGPGLRLPAISMGDPEQHVRVSLLRATKGGALASEFTAAGFGSLTRQAPAAPSTALQYDDAARRWRAFVTLPLEAGTPGLLPIAFAVWDGARGERAGYKRLTAWHFVRLPNRPIDPAWLKELAFGYFPGDLGDPAKGRVLAEAICVACHHLPGKALAPVGLAPNLQAVGAIATRGYLRDSIRAPSTVILHGPNPNQHYSPTEPKDKNGAYPNVDSYQWSAPPHTDGKPTSKMPPMQFPPEQLADLIAFLVTLDGTSVEKP